MTKHSTKFRSSQVLNVAQAAHVEVPLPLLGVLEDVEHAFFGLCIDAGKQVLSAMMEHDRTALCGLPWKPDPESTVRRAGSTESPITLGGRRISIARPRARTRDGQEVSLPSYEAASDRDPLDRQTLASMAAGVSTRRYAGTLDRLPQDERERATSKSAMSRRFAALTEQKLGEWLSQPLDELDLKVVMLDGIHFADHCILVALGIDSGGYKHPLGIVEGSTENTTVVKALLTDLIDRGLPADRALFFVIDGAKALRKAIRDLFGPLAKVQRCPVHKLKNVIDHLPKSKQAGVKRVLEDAWNAKSAKTARRQLERLARSLETEHPGAAESIREGLDETLTLLEMKIPQRLRTSLRSTNAIESVNDKIKSYARRVKRWRGGKMILRWTGAAILDAQKGFRRVKGYREIPHLVRALRQHEEDLGVHINEKAA